MLNKVCEDLDILLCLISRYFSSDILGAKRLNLIEKFISELLVAVDQSVPFLFFIMSSLILFSPNSSHLLYH